MTDRLYLRRAAAQIAEVIVSHTGDNDLRLRFKVVKNSWAKEPNTAHLDIFNLNEDRRGIIDQLIKRKIQAPVVIEAGYEEVRNPAVGVIFRGHLRSVAHSREGGDVITKMIAASYASADVPVAAVYKGPNLKVGAIAADMLRKIQSSIADVTVEGALESALSGDLSAIEDRYNKAVVIEDNALSAIERLTAEHGFRVSDQDGEIVVLKDGESLTGKSIVLNADSGLVGAVDPISDTRRPAAYLVRARSLLRHDIEIGTAVQIEGENQRGFFVVEHLEHQGDTHGGADAFITLFTGRALDQPRSIAPAGATDIPVTTGVIA